MITLVSASAALNTVTKGGAIRGNNLFHSFQKFDVSEGLKVYFANPNGVADIFSRVTGDNTSEISGTLGVEGNANLFLINPNGIVFGENAALDIRGSFLATTAESIEFADGTSFNANNPPKSPILTVKIPIGLGFGSNSQDIVVQGNGNELSFAIDTVSQQEILAGAGESSSGLRVQPNKNIIFDDFAFSMAIF